MTAGAALLVMAVFAAAAEPSLSSLPPTPLRDWMYRLDVEKLGDYSAERFFERQAIDQMPSAEELAQMQSAHRAKSEEKQEPAEEASTMSAAAADAGAEIYAQTKGSFAALPKTPVSQPQLPSASKPFAPPAQASAPSAPRRITPGNAVELDATLDDTKAGNDAFDKNLRSGQAPVKHSEKVFSNSKLPVE